VFHGFFQIKFVFLFEQCRINTYLDEDKHLKISTEREQCDLLKLKAAYPNPKNAGCCAQKNQIPTV